MKQCERTLKMKQEFLGLRQIGLTPVEIASKYGVSRRTMYTYLGEIAENAGVTRESLLEMPQRANGNKGSFFENEAHVELAKIDVAKDLAHFQAVSRELVNTRQAISNYLAAQEAINEAFYRRI